MKSFWSLLIKWIIIFLPLIALAVFLIIGGASIGMIIGLDTSPTTLEKQQLANLATTLMFFPPLIFGSLGSFFFLKWTKNIQSKFRKIFAFFWTPVLIFYVYLVGGEIISLLFNRPSRFVFLLTVLLAISIVILVVKKYRER